METQVAEALYRVLDRFVHAKRSEGGKVLGVHTKDVDRLLVWASAQPVFMQVQSDRQAIADEADGIRTVWSF